MAYANFAEFSEVASTVHGARAEELLQTSAISGIPYTNVIVDVPGYEGRIAEDVQYQPEYATFLHPYSMETESGLARVGGDQLATIVWSPEKTKRPEIVRYFEARTSLKESFYKLFSQGTLSRDTLTCHDLRTGEYYEWAGKMGLSAGMGVNQLSNRLCEMLFIPSAVGMQLSKLEAGEVTDTKLAVMHFPIISSPNVALEALQAAMSEGVSQKQ